MTFSTVVKDEVSKIDSTNLELISSLSAIIRNNAEVEDGIKITLENNAVARWIYSSIKKLYDVDIVVSVQQRIHFNPGFILKINENKELILKDLSIIDSNNNYLDIPKEYLINDEEQIRAYLRGIFLSTGSINDPKTSRYHLEFLVNTKTYANFVNDLLNRFNLNSKIIKRQKNYMIYIKEAEKISDFLRLIKAYNAVMYYEDIRIYRDHKNMTNRLNNCEQANVDKIFLTSSKQLKDIEKLKEYDMLDLLDDKLKEAIKYRVKYPESSLLELSHIISNDTNNKITKSGLNHRFRKIREIVNNIEKNK